MAIPIWSLFALAILLTIFAMLVSPASARPAPRAGLTRYPGARQACLVDAPSAYVQETRQMWCGDGRVAKVSLRTDTRNYAVQVDLSAVGVAAWQRSPIETSNRFRHTVDAMARRIRMNIAVTIRDADDARLAVCSRDLIARMATCDLR